MTLIKGFWSDGKGFVWLLVTMVLATISAQFATGMSWREMLLMRLVFFLYTIIAIASSRLSSTNKKIGYSVAIFILVFGVILLDLESKPLTIFHSTLLTTYMIFVLYLVVMQIFDGDKMTLAKIGGGIAVYVLIGHLWTSLYLTIYMTDPNAFLAGGSQISENSALRQLSYFSFVTLTTTGYGDITAITPAARTLVIFEGLFGQLFPAVFIAKLVSQQIEDSRK